MKSIYLAGPIWQCSDSDCRDWRQIIQDTFLDKFHFLDPMRRDYRRKAWLPPVAEEIVLNDKNDIVSCDVLLANCFKQSVGTSMEIFYANLLEKEIWILSPDFPIISPWLIYHGDYFFCSLQQVLKHLEQL